MVDIPDKPVWAGYSGMRTLGGVFVEVEQLSLPLAPELQIRTLHLQTLDVSAPSLVVKRTCPPTTIWTVEPPSVSSELLLLSSVVLYAPFAVDASTTRRLVGVLGDEGADLTD